jgi:hypothetical protein
MSFLRRITGLIPLRVKPEVSGKGIWLNRTIPDTSHKIKVSETAMNGITRAASPSEAVAETLLY